MIEIIPAIIPKNLDDLRDKVGQVAHYVKQIQIDICDGNFVPAKSWPYTGRIEEFERILHEEEGMPYWDKVDFEVDLMISNPEGEIEKWIVAGANRIIIHTESVKNIKEIVKINDNRADLGIALNIDTPNHEISGYLEDVKFVQFMGIAKIGYQREPFDDRVLDKIREFHSAHPEVIISVDGGVSIDNAHALIEAGVKRLVSGSAIFESGSIPDTLDAFKKNS